MEFISDRDECQTATNKTFLVLQSVTLYTVDLGISLMQRVLIYRQT